jgi:hypothetical protein
MEVDIRKYGGNASPLRCPLFASTPFTVFHHAGFQPFLDESHDALVRYTMLDEPNQPFVVDGVEETPVGASMTR